MHLDALKFGLLL